ncbi:hypothetical protein HAX54_047759 [Datura stramonium]|uniref:Uncharacterized protein n=1 Tax=Datura stramonium TaxID=4076 RepID=A0ABS8WMD3_DATST|nr:hypothetical protein [Datura stramonium]
MSSVSKINIKVLNLTINLVARFSMGLWISQPDCLNLPRPFPVRHASFDPQHHQLTTNPAGHNSNHITSGAVNFANIAPSLKRPLEFSRARDGLYYLLFKNVITNVQVLHLLAVYPLPCLVHFIHLLVPTVGPGGCNSGIHLLQETL